MRQVLALCAFHFFTLPKCNMEPQRVQIHYDFFLPDPFFCSGFHVKFLWCIVVHLRADPWWSPIESLSLKDSNGVKKSHWKSWSSWPATWPLAGVGGWCCFLWAYPPYLQKVIDVLCVFCPGISKQPVSRRCFVGSIFFGGCPCKVSREWSFTG